ncbi:hypothetical protein MKJ01_10550 [Chryseobacterium sp. SSA4.19]|uniref:hypothetical protein n=1 Tax=Chryseobacterium sp. SSA4.19 TaxID=2919915 RepID=UPI001F4D3946|nr:hypothetical protein [Chryseobacterium sp. SSA4.19]MCJ8154199.1 hypothetical protein [Chryseobacterium sp. SSA4.19]
MKKILILTLFSIFTQCHSQKNSKIMIPTVNKESETITKKIENGRADEINGKNRIIYTSAKIGFGEVKYNEDSYFSIIKNFYPTKKIQNKGVAFNEGAPIGIWYYFDQSGKLIKEENTDENYAFTYQDIIAYCELNKINLSKGYKDSGYQTRVLKINYENKYAWQISHQITADQIQEIILNGKDGKEITRKKVPFINN